MSIKHHLNKAFPRHLLIRQTSRSCIRHLSITFTILSCLSFQKFQFLKGHFTRSKLTSLKCPIWRSHFKDISFLLVLGVAKTQISVSGKRKNFTKQEGGVHEPIHVRQKKRNRSAYKIWPYGRHRLLFPIMKGPIVFFRWQKTFFVVYLNASYAQSTLHRAQNE